jgi:hypothetical protein
MIETIARYVLPAAFACLPDQMHTENAGALLLAIGLQESRFLNRRQLGGPARGFWQFEVGGVRGVMEHQATLIPIAHALSGLRYDHTLEPPAVQRLLEHNDILAAAFARCLLWTLPDALPGEDDPAAGWSCYVKAWRPGKPHRATWDANYARAWAVAQGKQEP